MSAAVSSSTSSNPSQSSSSSTATIAGAVGGAIGAVALIAVAVVLVRARSGHRHSLDRVSPSGSMSTATTVNPFAETSLH